MLIALYAALAMVFQDLMGTLLVQAEARNKAALAAGCDSVMWLAGIATTSISVTTLQGSSLHQKIIVIIAVSAANVVGTFTGVLIGKKLVKAEESTCKCSCTCTGCGGDDVRT